jgi:hypothetical protein
MGVPRRPRGARIYVLRRSEYTMHQTALSTPGNPCRCVETPVSGLATRGGALEPGRSPGRCGPLSGGHLPLGQFRRKPTAVTALAATSPQTDSRKRDAQTTVSCKQMRTGSVGGTWMTAYSVKDSVYGLQRQRHGVSILCSRFVAGMTSPGPVGVLDGTSHGNLMHQLRGGIASCTPS